VSEETFGARLRRERERRNIALSSISANSKISVGYFEALERNDLSRWPSGIFRRAFVRAYAAGIGLDPEATAREFLERFPDPADPTPVAPVETPGIVHARPGTIAPSDAVLRLTLADVGTPFVRGALLANMRSRCAAVGFDAAVMLAVAIGMYFVSGLFWLPLGAFTSLYYFGGVLILGNTPGVCLCAQTDHRRPTAGNPHEADTPAARSLLADLAALRDRARRAARVERREDLPV
jgi:transcriptional regulator with XRE-family HTH domain